jgi:hypothetical protein
LLLVSYREGTEWSREFMLNGELQLLLNKSDTSLLADIAAQVAAKVIGERLIKTIFF